MARDSLFSGTSAETYANHAYAVALRDLGRAGTQIFRYLSREDVLLRLREKHHLNVPVLSIDEGVISSSEDLFQITRQTADVNDERLCDSICVRIPFKGDRHLFSFRPSVNPPIGLMGEIGETALGVFFDQSECESNLRNLLVKAEVREIERCLQQIAVDFSGIIFRLQEQIAKLYEAYERQKSVNLDLAAINEVEAPRQISKNWPSARKVAGPTESSQYGAILATIESMMQVAERRPNAFRQMNEEDLRHHILLQLHSFDASGETFNRFGKTDIYIRVDGKSFIGECKVWQGPKSVKDAISQIVRYTTWRDTMTALILFSRKPNFSSVVSEAERTVTGHPLCQSGPREQGETQFRYCFQRPDDPERTFLLTLLVFDLS